MKEGSMDNKPTMKNRIIKYTESKRQRKKKELFEQIEKQQQTDTLIISIASNVIVLKLLFIWRGCHTGQKKNKNALSVAFKIHLRYKEINRLKVKYEKSCNTI